MNRTEDRHTPSTLRGGVTRREVLLAGGAGLVGLTLRGDAFAGVLANVLGQDVKLRG